VTEIEPVAGKLWLPVLGRLAFEERAWLYQAPDGGPAGFARLRVWEGTDGGHFAVVTESGAGLSVTEAAELIRNRLRNVYGEPFGLAELWPEGHSGPAHLDLVLPVRPGCRPQWLRLWPTGLGGTLRNGWDPDVARVWWMMNAEEILAP